MQAPETMKSVITAIYLITNGIGSLLTGVFYSALNGQVSRVVILIIFASIMLVVLFPFLVVRYYFVYVAGCVLEGSLSLARALFYFSLVSFVGCISSIAGVRIKNQKVRRELVTGECPSSFRVCCYFQYVAGSC